VRRGPRPRRLIQYQLPPSYARKRVIGTTLRLQIL